MSKVYKFQGPLGGATEVADKSKLDNCVFRVVMPANRLAGKSVKIL